MGNCTFLRRTLPGFLPRGRADKPLDLRVRLAAAGPASAGAANNKSNPGGNGRQGERDIARAGTGDRP